MRQLAAADLNDMASPLLSPSFLLWQVNLLIVADTCPSFVPKLCIGTKPPPLPKRRSPFAGFDSAGKSTKPFIILTVGTVAISAEMRNISRLRDRKRQEAAPGEFCCLLGRLSLVLVEIILACLEMCRVRGEHCPAAACRHQRWCVCLPDCLLTVHPLGADAGGAPRGGQPHPHRSPCTSRPGGALAGACRGAHRAHRAPLFPLTKGRLWLVRCPGQAVPHRPSEEEL